MVSLDNPQQINDRKRNFVLRYNNISVNVQGNSLISISCLSRQRDKSFMLLLLERERESTGERSRERLLSRLHHQHRARHKA